MKNNRWAEKGLALAGGMAGSMSCLSVCRTQGEAARRSLGYSASTNVSRKTTIVARGALGAKGGAPGPDPSGADHGYSGVSDPADG